ncbi:hypothetical protein BGX28_001103 [Mortierella sp. GBA30]|nr:hypothetical protein BGX28_001103 [Mortierella sp. GBA30]
MNFGPEWMRRFPSKTNSSSQSDLLQDWSQPAVPPSGSSGSAGNAGPAFSYSSVAANNVRSNGLSSVVPTYESSSLSDSLPSDTLNPFKYSKELMLSLFKPVGFPIEFERHEYATSEDALMPMSSQPFSDQEIKILSGSVNSEVARRVVQPAEGGQQDRQGQGQGQRAEGASNNDYAKDREHSGRHDRSDRRHHDKYQGSTRRHLNNDDRSHSFKRSDGTRDQDDGLWNSPGRSTVGSFDANGVFRVTNDRGEPLEPVHDDSALEPLQHDAKGVSPSDQPSDASESNDTSAFLSSQQSASDAAFIQDAGQSNAGQSFDGARPGSLVNGGLDDAAHKYPFSSTAMVGNDLNQSHDDSGFAPFGATNSSSAGFNSTPAFNQPKELSKWLYRDPSGSVQGPFQSEEMHEWYKGGFFSMDLLVKREQDATFEPLGSLIRRIGSDDKPFLVADLHATPLARPTISLPQNRHFNVSSWGGLSAPSTPGTPSFGVDRMFQQQQQQHVSGDMFGHQQQQQHSQDSFPGFEQKWNRGLFGHQQQQSAVEPNASWASGDAFARSSPVNGGLAGPQTPMSGSYMNQQQQQQQQRLLNQQLERQQYLQLLQRQIQMQHMLHQQQFMAAQQQFGNDPHAMSALLAQQQAQQRQLQLRLQQLQHMGFMGTSGVGNGGMSTPGGSMMAPLNGLGQPSSPWSASIIQSNSDNYFDRSHGENQNIPHSIQQPQQQQQQQHQDEQTVHQQQHYQHQEQQQQQQQQQQQHQEQYEEKQKDTQAQSLKEAEEQINSVSDSLEKLEVSEVQVKEEEEHVAREVEFSRAELIGSAVEEQVAEPEHEAEWAEEKEVVGEEPEEVEAAKDHVEEVEPPKIASWEDNNNDAQEEESAWGATTEESSGWGATTEESTWGTIAEKPRVIKAVPAPWAKPVGGEDAGDKKTLSLREIQEIEAKRAEEIRAAEREAQIASGASSVLDFGRSLGGTPWQTASAPKKTLREIQEEEEAAALRKARVAQANASSSSLVPASATSGAALPASAGSSTGLAAIVAAGTSGGKRYADTIGPKPATTVSSGPWGSPSSVLSPKTAPVARTSSTPSISHTSSAVISSARASSRVEDNHGWIEVSSQKSASTTVAADPIPTRATTQKKFSASSSSDEPRPASEEFLRWCRQALKGLQGVMIEDFIQMLLSFPLNPDPMTVEIIQDSIYANSQSLNGRQFADEFVKRRKADAYPNGMNNGPSNGANNSSIQQSSSGHDGSFKVVSKKGRKKGTA